MRAFIACSVPLLSAVALHSGIHRAPRARPESRVDTIDVAVGSPLVSGMHLTPFSARVVAHRLVAGAAPALGQDVTNTFSFDDSSGTALVRVRSVGTAGRPDGGTTPVEGEFTFDRRTMALRAMRQRSMRGELTLTVTGDSAALTMPTPAGPRATTLSIGSPAFYGPWADVVVEELPRKLGATYRVKLWQPAPPSADHGPSVAIETHVYTFAAREDVEVLGTKHARAWVVEDRDARGEVVGRMWLIDAAPRLVRWSIYRPDGAMLQIDQQLVAHP